MVAEFISKRSDGPCFRRDDVVRWSLRSLATRLCFSSACQFNAAMSRISIHQFTSDRLVSSQSSNDHQASRTIAVGSAASISVSASPRDITLQAGAKRSVSLLGNIFARSWEVHAWEGGKVATSRAIRELLGPYDENAESLFILPDSIQSHPSIQASNCSRPSFQAYLTPVLSPFSGHTTRTLPLGSISPLQGIHEIYPACANRVMPFVAHVGPIGQGPDTLIERFNYRTKPIVTREGPSVLTSPYLGPTVDLRPMAFRDPRCRVPFTPLPSAVPSLENLSDEQFLEGPADSKTLSIKAPFSLPCPRLASLSRDGTMSKGLSLGVSPRVEASASDLTGNNAAHPGKVDGQESRQMKNLYLKSLLVMMITIKLGPTATPVTLLMSL